VQVLIPILIVIALAVLAGAVIVMRRRSAAPTEATAPDRAAKPVIPEPLPMNDLEAALSKVTDRTGRPIRDRIDAEAGHVDDLRVPDDTGPLLRRALDHVASPAGDDDRLANDVDTGDVDTGDVDTGDVDTGDVDTDETDTDETVDGTGNG